MYLLSKYSLFAPCKLGYKQGNELPINPPRQSMVIPVFLNKVSLASSTILAPPLYTNYKKLFSQKVSITI